MIEVSNPWKRVPFYIGYSNQYYTNGTGYNNVGIIDPTFANLKADCPTSISTGTEGGYSTISNVTTELVYTYPSMTDVVVTSIPRFEVLVVEGDYANAPWVGLTVTQQSTVQTDVTEYIGGTWNTTTTYSTLTYTYNITSANYIPDPMDPNWTSPNRYTTPWASTPPGPSFVSYAYEDLGGGDYRITYGYRIDDWTYISVVPSDFETG
jgi:hypothetical protein